MLRRIVAGDSATGGGEDGAVIRNCRRVASKRSTLRKVHTIALRSGGRADGGIVEGTVGHKARLERSRRAGSRSTGWAVLCTVPYLRVFTWQRVQKRAWVVDTRRKRADRDDRTPRELLWADARVGVGTKWGVLFA